MIEVDTTDASLVVHEPKQKVDLTKYVEMHQFCFDTAMNEDVTNDQVYSYTVQPLVATLFRGGKATCFAYGQVGVHALVIGSNNQIPCSWNMQAQARAIGSLHERSLLSCSWRAWLASALDADGKIQRKISSTGAHSLMQ